MRFVYTFLCLLLFNSITKAQEKNLDFFLQQAKNNSALFKDYQNQLRSLTLDSSIIKAGLRPQVSAATNLYYAPIIKGFGYDPAISNGQLINGLVTVSKQITPNTRIRTLLTAIQLSKDSLGVQKEFSTQDIYKSISSQYITAWGSQQNLELSYKILSLLQKQDTILKKLTQKSVFKQTDYLTFKVALEQQLFLVKQNETQLKYDLSSLNLLSGIKDTTSYQLAPLNLQKIKENSIGETLILKRYAIDSLRTINALKQLAYNYKPKASVFADGGYQSSLPSNYYKNFGFSVGLNLSIPIYDGGLRKLNTQQIKLRQQTQYQYKEYYQNQFAIQQKQLKDMVLAYADLIKKADSQLLYSKTLIKANELQLSTGDIRMTDYLLSISNYLNTEVSLLQNKLNQLQTINQLHYFTLK
ncbi:TolC family protein [Pedobacter sp. SD-b]|uniref:TolC family protein n=1 Tax=Pedobacter segetis TaxID=2793069 RepID=A0ABS1BI31_9SPHI|nr:TolC family protein [Pedobacter segetis]MBK0382546.1 TolC family protein [Pedobacter segetis]